MKYTTKCAAMGGDWLRYNGMTERWEFLVVVVSRQELFRSRWEQVHEWLSQETSIVLVAEIKSLAMLTLRSCQGEGQGGAEG